MYSFSRPVVTAAGVGVGWGWGGGRWWGLRGASGCGISRHGALRDGGVKQVPQASQQCDA